MISTAIHTVTAQTTTAVSLTEIKAQLPTRISGTGDDTLLTQLISAAQEHVEVYTNLRLMESTFDFFLTGWPKNGIVLPFNPIKSITSIKYYNTSNVETTWASTNYFYSIYEKPCRIRYVDGSTPPDLYEDRFDAVTVRFVCGYTSADAISAAVKQAILLMATDLYINRDDKVRTMFTMWQRLANDRVFHELNENAE